MYSFDITSTASSRVILSLLFNADKIEDGELKLKKKEISGFWTTSKSSKRDINKEASDMIGMRMQKMSLPADFDGTPERILDSHLFDGIRSTNYDVDFEFNPELIDDFKLVAKLLFDKYELNDFKEFTSRFTLNVLLASLDSDDVLYSVIRDVNNINDVYSVNQNFYRNVIDVVVNDIKKIESKKVTTEVLERINPNTKRKASYALKVSS